MLISKFKTYCEIEIHVIKISNNMFILKCFKTKCIIQYKCVLNSFFTVIPNGPYLYSIYNTHWTGFDNLRLITVSLYPYNYIAYFDIVSFSYKFQIMVRSSMYSLNV